MRLKNLSILLLTSLCFGGLAQDYSWWNEKHNWDGLSPWNSYLIVSPGFLGPNALPVPEIQKGKLPRQRSFELGLEGHYSKGDQTGNLVAQLFFPLFSDRVGLGIYYVPLEMYQTDTLTRDLRRSREYDGKGTSQGDAYFSTYIHLVEESEKIPDIMLTINLKTASGRKFSAARHTNAPAYYFDLSAGKTMYEGDGLLQGIRSYVLAGFYVYQTNLGDYMQNDAFEYGAGLDFDLGSLKMEHQLGGYVGYLNNGDRPMVYRMNLLWQSSQALQIRLRYQQGFMDFPFSSIRLSTLLNF